jgi:AcrR family transcriptional regulator
VRADALRNADAVLQTAAILLARDPSTSIGAIATAAGVDRSTVYRRFANREALVSAIHAEKMAASREAIDLARLEEADVVVALHRWVEGTIGVSRRWPVDLERYARDPDTAEHTEAMRDRLDAFVVRAQEAGVIDPALPVRWVRTLLTQAMSAAAHQLPDVEPGPAADLVVRTLLDGVAPPTPA